MKLCEVIWPGALTTIQDIGRPGYQRYGVPVSGAMDNFAICVANRLLDNTKFAAALECTLFGPKLRFFNNTLIAITGGNLKPLLNNQSLPMWQVAEVQKGDILSWGGVSNGCRAYLAVAGGIDVCKILGSRSTYLPAGIGGLEGRALKTGDVLRSFPSNRKRLEHIIGRKVPQQFIPEYKSLEEIRVILGPQVDYFSEENISTFLNSEYTITPESDRMGYRFEGPEIKHGIKMGIISDGIPLGAIQVSGNGKPIVMMADRQTIGGYAKIATVVTPDISKFAQMKPDDKVRFQELNLAQAHKVLKVFQKTIEQLKFE